VGLILYALTRRAGGIPPSAAERRRGAHRALEAARPPMGRDPGAQTAQAKVPPNA
jgi:hypothetical protein